MEVIWSLFTILSTVITDILYDKALINNLFSFNLDDKKVIIKKNENKNYNPLLNGNDKLSSQKTVLAPSSSTNMKYDYSQSPSILNEEKINKNLNKETIEINIRKKKRKSSRLANQYISGKQEEKNFENNNKESKKLNNINNVNAYGLIPFSLSNDKININREINVLKENENKKIISHIKLNNCCIYF